MSSIEPQSEPDSVSSANAQAESDPPVEGVMRPVSRRRATIWTTFFGYGNVVLLMVRNLGLVPLYLTYITNVEYLAWLATGGVLHSLTIVDFGLTAVVGQQVAMVYGLRDKERLQRLVGTGLAIVLAISLLAGLCAAILSPLVPIVMRFEEDSATRLSLAFLIAACATAVQLGVHGLSHMLKSFQRSFLTGFLDILSEAASLVLTAVLVVRGWGLYGIAVGFALRSALRLIGNLTFLLQICYRDLGLRIRWSKSEAVGLWKLTLHQFAARLANILQDNLDPFVIAAILGPKIAGFYVLTIRAHETVRLLLSQLAAALQHSLAHLHGEGNTARFKEIITRTYLLQAAAAAIGMGGVIVFNERFMSLWVGSGKFVGQGTSICFALFGILHVVSSVSYTAIYAQGDFRTIAKTMWLSVAIRMPVIVILLLLLGPIGVPIAAFIATSVAFGWKMTGVVLDRLSFDTKQMLKLGKRIGKLLVGPLAVAVMYRLISSALESDRFDEGTHPAQSWLILGGFATVYLAAALIVAVISDWNLVRFIRSGGKDFSAKPTGD